MIVWRNIMARQSGNTLIIESKEDIIEELDLLDVDEMVKRVQTADVGTEYMLIRLHTDDM